MTLTNSDRKEIREIVHDELKEQLTDLKSDFIEKIDPILKEVITAREERPSIENRLEALEEIHQEGPHSISN